jgi:hypothetical protein
MPTTLIYRRILQAFLLGLKTLLCLNVNQAEDSTLHLFFGRYLFRQFRTQYPIHHYIYRNHSVRKYHPGHSLYSILFVLQTTKKMRYSLIIAASAMASVASAVAIPSASNSG